MPNISICKKLNQHSFLGFAFLFIYSLPLAAAPKIVAVRPDIAGEAKQSQAEIASSPAAPRNDERRPEQFAGVSLPSEFARVEREIPGTNGRTLILIQEAHVDYNAQKAIAEILKHLIEKESLKLILVEGGWGDVSLSYLREHGIPQARLNVAERYLKDGFISGDDYLDLVSDEEMIRWGVEDRDLYGESMEAFLELDSVREGLNQNLASLGTILAQLQEKIFSPTLQEALTKRENFRNHNSNLIAYLQFLERLDRAEWQRFPKLEKIRAVAKKQSQFDADKAEWEKNNLVQILSRKLTKPEFHELRILQKPRNNQDEARFLESLFRFHRSLAKDVSQVPIKNLQIYAVLLRETEKVDSGILFSEVERLEETLLNKLAKTKDEKRLLEIQRQAERLKKLLNLKLTPPEYEPLEKNGVPRLSSFQKWIERALKSHSLGGLSRPDFDLLERQVPVAKEYYEAARKRETAMIRNADEKIQASGESLAVLIIGGFHFKELIAAFEAKGYALLSVFPEFTINPDQLDKNQTKYFEILKSKWQASLGRGRVPEALKAPAEPRRSPEVRVAGFNGYVSSDAGLSDRGLQTSKQFQQSQSKGIQPSSSSLSGGLRRVQNVAQANINTIPTPITSLASKGNVDETQKVISAAPKANSENRYSELANLSRLYGPSMNRILLPPVADVNKNNNIYTQSSYKTAPIHAEALREAQGEAAVSLPTKG